MLKSKLTLLVLAASVVLGTSAHSEENNSQNANRHRMTRWDFSCTFENGNTCHALASIFTRRPLMTTEVDVLGSGGSTPVYNNPNKLAVLCERGGMLYANGASVSMHHDHLTISAAGGYKPALVFDLPLTGETDQPVTLLRSHREPITGTCTVHSHQMD